MDRQPSLKDIKQPKVAMRKFKPTEKDTQCQNGDLKSKVMAKIFLLQLTILVTS